MRTFAVAVRRAVPAGRAVVSDPALDATALLLARVDPGEIVTWTRSTLRADA